MEDPTSLFQLKKLLQSTSTGRTIGLVTRFYPAGRVHTCDPTPPSYIFLFKKMILNHRHVKQISAMQRQISAMIPPHSVVLIRSRSRSPKIHAACLFSSDKRKQKSHTCSVPIALPPIRNHSAPSLLAHRNRTAIRHCLVQRRCRPRASLHDHHAKSRRRSGIRALRR
jgi:hypothetical protein